MLDDVTAPTVSIIAVGTGATEYAWSAMSSFASSGQSTSSNDEVFSGTKISI